MYQLYKLIIIKCCRNFDMMSWHFFFHCYGLYYNPHVDLVIISCYSVNFHAGPNVQMVLPHFDNVGDKERLALFNKTISFWRPGVHFYTILNDYFLLKTDNI